MQRKKGTIAISHKRKEEVLIENARKQGQTKKGQVGMANKPSPQVVFEPILILTEFPH